MQDLVGAVGVVEPADAEAVLVEAVSAEAEAEGVVEFAEAEAEAQEMEIVNTEDILESAQASLQRILNDYDFFEEVRDLELIAQHAAEL